MTELNTIEEFRSSHWLRESLMEHVVLKRFAKGDALMIESSYIRSIPIVMKGSRLLKQLEDSSTVQLGRNRITLL